MNYKFGKILVFLGEGTFTLYISHWLWLGLIRNIQSNFTGVIIPFAAFLVVATFMSIVCSFIQRFIVNEFKNKIMYKTKFRLNVSFLILICLCLTNFVYPNAWSISTIPHNDQIQANLTKVEENSESLNWGKVIATFRIRNISSESIEGSECFILDKTKRESIQIDQPYPYSVQGKFKLAPQETAYFSVTVPHAGDQTFDKNAYLMGCR